MPDYSNHKHVFTYGSYNQTSRFAFRWSSSPALIFACLDGTDQTFSEFATPLSLSSHPIVSTVMGETYFVKYFPRAEPTYYNRDSTPRWVFTLDSGTALRAMSDNDHESVFLKVPGHPLGALTTKKILDDCYLPHKHTMTCIECATSIHSQKHKDSKAHCILKKAVQQTTGGHYTKSMALPAPYSLDNIREDFELVNGKTKIGDFTYISPALTAPGVPANVRSVNDHDFSAIQEFSDVRGAAQKERKRFRQFQKQVCTICAVASECRRSATSWEQRGCRGAYVGEKKSIIAQILDSVVIPFTNKQLRYLLNHSGILKKRYGRRIVVGTFAMDGCLLTYKIRYKTTPHDYASVFTFRDFKAAKKFLSKYNPNVPDTGYVAPMSKERKATLCELASRDSSPRGLTGWGGSYYPVLHIISAGTHFRVSYSYHGRSTLYATVTARDIENIYGIYGAYRFASKEHHVLQSRSSYY